MWGKVRESVRKVTDCGCEGVGDCAFDEGIEGVAETALADYFESGAGYPGKDVNLEMDEARA